MTQRSRRREFILSALSAPFAGSLLSLPVSAQQRNKVAAFDHVSFPMQEAAKMGDFYKRLGFTVDQDARMLRVIFRDSKLHFHGPEMWQREGFTLRGPNAKPGCGDWCFLWNGTSEELKATLDKAGAKVIEGPVKRDGGRNGGKAVGTSMYIRDPDMNLLEFIIYP